MLSNHEIADMNYCRRCINQKYNIHLKRSDVVVFADDVPLRTLRGDEAPRPSRQMERPVETSVCPRPQAERTIKKRKKSAVRELPRALLRVKKHQFFHIETVGANTAHPYNALFEYRLTPTARSASGAARPGWRQTRRRCPGYRF